MKKHVDPDPEHCFKVQTNSVFLLVGDLTLRFSRQLLKWARRFFSSSLWLDLHTGSPSVTGLRTSTLKVLRQNVA
jgi:hypothetical protein